MVRKPRDTDRPTEADPDWIEEHLSPAARATRQRVISGRFRGFQPPRSNYYKSPNDLTNIKARIIRNGGNASACVVLDYIIRHTWGFQEYGISKRITLDEFTNGRKYADGSRMDLGAGPAQRTIVDCLKYLESNGYIMVDVDDSDRGRIAKYYSVAMDPDEDGQTF
jgi:hypothetical protein